MKLYGAFTKIEELDDGTLKVTGIASSGAVDDAGETITPAAMKAALPEYLRFGAIREMHGLSAAGTALKASVDENGFTNIEALIVDPLAIKKIQTGVYKGLSVGGKVLQRDSADRSVITKIKLNEISCVDRPCNPDALLDLWKAADTETEGQEMTYAPTNDEVKALAETMAKAAGKTGKANDFLAKARGELIAKHVEPEAVVAPEADAASVVEPVEKVAEDAEVDTVDVAAIEPVEPAAETVEPEVVAEKVDLADALTAAVEKAATAVAVVEPVIASAQVTPGLADFGKGLAKLGEVYGADPLAKGLWTVAALAQVIEQLAGIQASTAWEAEMEGDASPIPQALATSIQSLGASLVSMASEEIAELLADMNERGGDVVIEIVDGDDGFAYAASVVDLVKADADLMEKAGARHSKKDMSAIQAMHDSSAKLGAKCDAGNSEKAAGGDDDLTKALAANTKLNEAVEKALPAIETLTKGLEDARAEIDLLKAQPMPSRAAGSVHAVTKADDASPATAPVQLTPDQITAELAKMSDHDRAMLLTKAALRLPMSAA